MDSSLFKAPDAGRVIRVRSGYDAFVPAALPPTLSWETRFVRAVEEAAKAIGEFDAVFTDEVNARFGDLLLLRAGTDAAALEGQRIRMHEAFMYGTSDEYHSRGAILTHNFAAAHRHVAARLHEIPLSLRLIREAHLLLSKGLEHMGTYAGEFRRSQNWIGPEGCGLARATLVPPPVEEMKTALDNWEKYIHANDPLPNIVRAALVHYQFAVIRPFLEYNDSALLVMMPFILQQLGASRNQATYPGLFIARQPYEWHYRIMDTCQRGAWNEWLAYYLFGVAGTIRELIATIRRLQGVYAEHVRRSSDGGLTSSALLELLYRRPSITAELAGAMTGESAVTATEVLEALTRIAVVSRQEWRDGVVYVAQEIIEALEPATIL